jgi:hypothetical protein
MAMRNQALYAALVAVTSLAGAVAPAYAAADHKPKTEEPAKPANQKICVESKVTGSILSRRDCRTRAEWIALTGTDPSTPQRK